MFFWKKDKSKDFEKLSKAEKEGLARQFLDDGNRSLEKGKHEAALDSFRQLIRLDPRDPDHRRRLADCHGKLGDKKSEMEARCKAATLYAEAGFLLKGIAMCKLALAIDPAHQQTQKQLASLNELAGHARPVATPPRRLTGEEEAARKTHALSEARARVEKVRATRDKTEAVQKALDEAARSEKANAEKLRAETLAPDSVPTVKEAPAPDPSLAAGAPLTSVPLHSVIPRVRPHGSVPRVLTSVESDEEIFIAPLDEDDEEELDEVEPEEELEELDLEPEETQDSSSSNRSEGLESALLRVPLLSDLSRDSFIALINEVSFCQLKKGEVLFEVGAPADAMYCVVEGEVQARLPGPFGQDFELARLGEGAFFGEIGLLADQPRQATIAATEETLLLVFERNIVTTLGKSEPDFIRILLRFVRERLVASLIATNPLFAPFAGSEAEDLTRRFRFLEVKARKPLVRQGSPSGGVFILLTGGARVIRSQDGKIEELGRLGPGDIFGEMSLINRQDAVASVVTSLKSYVLELPARDFTELVMMHPALLSYVSTLALERQAKNEALLHRAIDFKEDRLSLM